MSAKNLNDFVPFYFDPERVGKSLKKISSDLVSTKSQKIRSTWYQGTDGADFFTWTDEAGNYVKFQLTYCGQITEWNIVNGIRTGVVIEEDSTEPGISASELIQYDHKILDHTLSTGRTLISFIEEIPADKRARLLELLDNNLTIDSMSQEEFWDKYGYRDVKFSKNKSLLGLRILFYHFRRLFRKLR